MLYISYVHIIYASVSLEIGIYTTSGQILYILKVEKFRFQLEKSQKTRLPSNLKIMLYTVQITLDTHSAQGLNQYRRYINHWGYDITTVYNIYGGYVLVI